jgi:hypothetical protein
MWWLITVGVVVLAAVVWLVIHRFTDLGSAAQRHQATDPETAQALRDAQQQIDVGRGYGHMF